MAETKIRALFIFEVMGRPPEHLKKALEEYLKTFGENKGIKIIRKEIHEPKPIEKQGAEGQGAEGLFTTFAEVEVVVDNLNLIFEITLNMLPAHAEIIEPDNIILKNFDLSGVISNLSVKLHKYDEIAKAIALERNGLIRKMQEMQERINNLEGNIRKPEAEKLGEEKPGKKKKVNKAKKTKKK